MNAFICAVKHKKPIIAAVFVGIVLSLVIFIFALYESDRINQLKKLEATEQFAHFDNMIANKIYTITNLIKGFEAYIMSTDHHTDEDVYAYLDILLKDELEFIHNVGILKDTTIVWNYPYEENKSTIGIDLATHAVQGQYVMRVKNNLESIFQGPVNLIQGGEGFVIRAPILDQKGDYWGMSSLIIKIEAFKQVLDEYQDELGIEVVILSDNNVLFGNSAIISKNIEWFDYNEKMFNWKIGVDVGNNYKSEQFKITVLFIIGFIVFFLITLATYLSIQANEIIKNEALHDQLTGARNRNGLPEEMEQFMASANRNEHKVGILLLDLNKFKEINDTFGHIVGDVVLIETTKRLKGVSRSDEIVYRVGGDEFLLIIPMVENEDMIHKAQKRIKEQMVFELEIKELTISVGASVGCAIYPDDGTTFDEIFQIADKRMYEDKKNM